MLRLAEDVTLEFKLRDRGVESGVGAATILMLKMYLDRLISLLIPPSLRLC